MLAEYGLGSLGTAAHSYGKAALTLNRSVPTRDPDDNEMLVTVKKVRVSTFDTGTQTDGRRSRHYQLTQKREPKFSDARISVAQSPQPW
jgi:hypothetical protein